MFGHSIQDAIDEANRILTDAIREHNPSHLFGMFSGGHDSLCSTHLCSERMQFTAAVHINTEIGIEATRQFARDTAKRQHWRFIEKRPPRPPFKDKHGNLWGKEGQTAYEAMVMKWGFPGPSYHRLMYIRLKERSLRALAKEFKVKGKPMIFVTGVRLQESSRRMGHVKPVQKDGSVIWVSPILNWTNEDKNDYIDLHKLPRNKIATQLCMSGECLCGAFAKPDELCEIRRYAPDVASYLDDLQEQVKATGQKRCVWGDKSKAKKGEGGMLCSSCLFKWDNQ